MSADTAALPDPRPTADKDAALVQSMFDRVAARYDLANAVLSGGQDQHWRRVAVKAVDPRAGERILDVAAGTGMLAHELRRSGADVIALDFSWNMLHTGARREARGRNPGAGGLRWLNGDGTRLPLPDASVDAVTISFGLRNLPDTAGGLRELARVTKPGGRLLVLEFSRPTWAPFRELYLRYLLGALPRIAEVVTSDPAAYRYLAASIVAWPDQNALAHTIQDAGWGEVRWKNLSGGIVAAHHAVRPAAT
jgi:demethylmenaquinone methyltransferase / 2-methoxy-6-polyprenyl-1,4-benzoquinol methylase